MAALHDGAGGYQAGLSLGHDHVEQEVVVQTSRGASGAHLGPQILGNCSENHSLSTDSKAVLRQTWKNVIYG